MSRAQPVLGILALFMTSVLGAGCVTSDPGDEEGATSASDLGEFYVNLPGAYNVSAPPYSTLLCRDKLMQLPFDDATGRRVQDRCNFEVTVFNGPANEISMAVNPRDPLNVVAGAKDYSLSEAPGCTEYNVWNGYYYSTDGGMTWGNGMMPGYPGGPDGPLSGNLCNTDPVLVFDGDGNPWYSGLNYRGARNAEEPSTGTGGPVTGSQVYFGKSTDKGQTYGEMYFSSLGDNDNIFNDKQWFAIDESTGHMYLTWTDFVTPGGACPPTGCGQVMFSESIDGTTWTTPFPLFEAGDPQPNEQFSMPIVGPSGEVYVLWMHFGQPQVPDVTTTTATLHLATGIPQLGLAELGLGGMAPLTAFTPATPEFPLEGAYFGGLPGHDFRSATLPVGVMDATGGPNHGCLYIVWAAILNDADVMLAKNCDGGTGNWERMSIVDGPGHQFMPWIDVAPDGSVHIAYYTDERSGSLGTRLDLHYVHSIDGEDWEAPLRISEVSSDPAPAYHQSGANFIGDYIALDTSELGVHISWADTRHGTSDVYHAVVLRSPDDGAVFHAAPPTLAEAPPYFDQVQWKKDLEDEGNATTQR